MSMELVSMILLTFQRNSSLSGNSWSSLKKTLRFVDYLTTVLGCCCWCCYCAFITLCEFDFHPVETGTLNFAQSNPSSSSSSSSTNFIGTQVLKQNFRAAMCHVLHYSCNVSADVADSLHCRMICGTVPSSVHAWMPPATAATWSPAAAHSKSLPWQRGRRDCRWFCATTVKHAAMVTMQIVDAYVTRCRRPAVAHCWDNVVLCRSYNGKLERWDTSAAFRDQSKASVGARSTSL